METVDVVLVCSGTGETENGSLTFSNPPQIVKDIKLAVEEKFNIPAFCQALSFDSHILRDDQKLSYTRARSGDTFHVRYHSKADCAKIKEVIGWLGQLVSGFKNETPTISNGISLELQLILRSRVGRALGANLFITGAYGSPSLSNRHYFHHHGGTDTILEVYRAILRNPWNVTPYYIKLIECRILSALWNFTADSTDNFAMRNHLVSIGAMEMLMKSLLRVRIGEEECIGADLAIRGERYTLVYLLENAVGVISNMSEAPTSRMLIASNADVLDQLTCVAVTPSPLQEARPLVVNLFINLSYSTELHAYITKPQLLNRLMKTSRMCKESDSNADIDEVAIRYFTQLYLALVILPSPECIIALGTVCQDIYLNMTVFFKDQLFDAVLKWEQDHDFFWSTLLPLVSALYIPNIMAGFGLLEKLQLLSIETILFALRVMLIRENQRKILAKEGLLDYIRCLPAHVPVSLRSQAKKVVEIASDKQTHSPPSLLVTVKAHIAKTFCGLDKVLELSIGQLCSELLV